MITCQNCSHKEMEGVIFCSECGGQLIFTQGIHTTGMQKTDGITQEPTVIEPTPTPSFPNALITLHVINKNVYLHIEEFGEVIVGRGSEGQSMVPDIDLHPYQAFDSGVSRLHAAIKIDPDQIIVFDLGSSNGTSINGIKITPNEPNVLKNGDLLCFGKLKIEVITKIGGSQSE